MNEYVDGVLGGLKVETLTENYRAWLLNKLGKWALNCPCCGGATRARMRRNRNHGQKPKKKGWDKKNGKKR